jgi:hypothetical protein
MATKSTTPYRQIRAHFDDSTITVYQAYNSTIAAAAVAAQKLDASPAFLPHRMTWIKPSWCWMMYRSGYSLKDANQERILAIKMTHDNFRELLMHAVVCHGQKLSPEDAKKEVRVQWDPERTAKLGVLPYRSIQIGISGKVKEKWVTEWIVGIEDVTEKALGLMGEVKRKEKASQEELEALGYWPEEKVYEVDVELRGVLMMDETGD